MKMSRFADFSRAAMHGIPAVDGRGSLHPPISLSLSLSPSPRVSEAAKVPKGAPEQSPRWNGKRGARRRDGVGEGEEASFRYATLRAMTDCDWPTSPSGVSKD